MNSNMLLVISKITKQQCIVRYSTIIDSNAVVSCITCVANSLEGHKDILCKSHIPLNVVDGRWNYYLSGESNEFVTIAERKYHYWKISNTLNSIILRRRHVSENRVPSRAKKTNSLLWNL